MTGYGAPRPCIPSSAPPSSTTSIPRPGSPMSCAGSRRRRRAGSANSSHGTGRTASGTITPHRRTRPPDPSRSTASRRQTQTDIPCGPCRMLTSREHFDSIRSVRPWSQAANRPFCASREPISASFRTIKLRRASHPHGFAKRLWTEGLHSGGATQGHYEAIRCIDLAYGMLTVRERSRGWAKKIPAISLK